MRAISSAAGGMLRARLRGRSRRLPVARSPEPGGGAAAARGLQVRRVAAVGQDLVGPPPRGVLRRPLRDPARGPGHRGALRWRRGEWRRRDLYTPGRQSPAQGGVCNTKGSRDGTSPIPTWEIPIWKDISPRQKKVNEALKLINSTLDELIAICKRLVEQEDLQFHEEYMNEQDPSILHFLLASGDDVSSKQLRDDLMTMLIAGHEASAAVLTWTFYLLSKYPKVMAKLQDEVDSVLGDGLPTIEDVKKLKYTTRVINESDRIRISMNLVPQYVMEGRFQRINQHSVIFP